MTKDHKKDQEKFLSLLLCLSFLVPTTKGNQGNAAEIDPGGGAEIAAKSSLEDLANFAKGELLYTTEKRESQKETSKKTKQENPKISIIVSNDDVFFLGDIAFQLNCQNPEGAKKALTSIYNTEIGKRVFASSFQNKQICLKDKVTPDDHLFCVPCPLDEMGAVRPEELLKNLVLCAQRVHKRTPMTSGDDYFNRVVALTSSIVYKDEMGIVEDNPILNYYRYLKKDISAQYSRITYGKESFVMHMACERLLQAFITEKIDPKFPEKNALLQIIGFSKSGLQKNNINNTISDDCSYGSKMLGIPNSNKKIVVREIKDDPVIVKNPIGKQPQQVVASLENH